MHELKINIADNVFKQFMKFIDILPKGSIEIEELSNTNTDLDPFYNKRKEMIQQRIQDIDNGKLETQSFIDEKSRIQYELESIDKGATMINDDDFWANTEKVINHRE